VWEREIKLVGTIASEKSVNAVGERSGVSAFSEKSDFSGRVGEGSVNKEPVEISW
jgi:hypothetical protein